MRTHKHFYLAVLCLLTVYGSVNAQGDCFYEYSYETQEHQIIQFNEEYPEESLTDYELAYARPQLINSINIHCFNDELELTTETTYGNAPDADEWITPIGRSIADKNTIKLYDFEGNLLREVLNDEGSDSIYQYNIEELHYYDVYPVLVYPSEEELLYMEESGMTVYDIGDNILYIFQDGQEMIIDYNNQTITENVLDESIITEQRIDYYAPIDEERSLLVKSISNTFKTFPSGAVLRNQNKKIHYNHRINDDLIVRQSQTDLRGKSAKVENLDNGFSTEELVSKYKFTITPNPATNEVSVVIPSLGKYEDAQLKILDITGRAVFSEGVTTQSTQNVSLGKFSSGHYQVLLNIGEKVLCHPLVVIK